MRTHITPTPSARRSGCLAAIWSKDMRTHITPTHNTTHHTTHNTTHHTTHNTTHHTTHNPKTRTHRFLGMAALSAVLLLAALAAVLLATGCSSSREAQPASTADTRIGRGAVENPSGAGDTAEPPPSSKSSNPRVTETETTLSDDPPTGIDDGTTTTNSTAKAPPSERAERLQAELDRLAALAVAWDDKAEVALAVITSEGVSVGVNADMRHSSASAAKSLWLAAALSHLDVEAVQPLVRGALVESDNKTAGEVIDLIGASIAAADSPVGAVGVSAINEWTEEVVELKNTRLLAWRFPLVDVEAAQRRAPEISENQAAENYTTTADLARFYAQLWRGELLDREETAALIGWLKTTERGTTIDAVDDAMAQRLPSAVADEVGHKAGWLPPSCCSVRLILDAGVVPLPDGGWFSIAALSMRGEHYELSLQWVALAACRIYLLLSSDEELVCERPSDGIPYPEAWPEPTIEQPPEPNPPEQQPDPTTSTLTPTAQTNPGRSSANAASWPPTSLK